MSLSITVYINKGFFFFIQKMETKVNRKKKSIRIQIKLL